jgi:methoxymalonate biosynthesis protein
MTRDHPVREGAVQHGTVRGSTVKCVVWDIDNSLLTGIYLESGDRPPGPDPVLTAVLAELGGRGILHAIASKNPPEAAEHTARVTGWRFAATECGWDRKSDALARIAAALGIAVDTLAFVDDDPYERAEVSSVLPGVLVLSPEEAAEATGWPEFSPPVITPEARRRGEMYAERQRRQAAERSFGGTREEFLESVGTRVTIAAATAADVPRLHELAARTRQFNSAGAGVTESWLAGLLRAENCGVVTVRLRDAFGDDGVVGGCVISREAGTWTVPLVMMSCRAMGRGVIDAVLAWAVRQAARAGARGLRIPCVANSRNVPLRLALAATGFRAPDAAAAAGAAAGADDGDEGAAAAGVRERGGADGGLAPAVYQRDLGTPLPSLPGWVSAPGEPGGADVTSITDDLRSFLAAATGRDELLRIPPTAALFGTAVGLDSLTGTLLLREIQRRFGVDVAGEDLNLDSLATLGTLATFVAQRVRPRDSR